MTHGRITRVRWGAGMALLLLLAGCRGRDVVVRAGKTEVRRAELELFKAAGSADPAAALDRLAERALLAEAGRRAGVDEAPAVRARLDAAAREIRAQAYLEKELAGAPREEALRRAYLERKDQLARRRVHVAHIVFQAKTPADRAQAQSRASLASARLADGVPFDQLARERSEDRVSAERGGDLGVVMEGQVDEAFFEAVAQLKRGEVSRPIESPFGFHLVRALEDPQRVTPTYEEAKGLLAAEARREAEAALLARLRREIGVTTYPERVPARTTPASKGREGR